MTLLPGNKQLICYQFSFHRFTLRECPGTVGLCPIELADVISIAFNSAGEPVSPRTPLLTIN